MWLSIWAEGCWSWSLGAALLRMVHQRWPLHSRQLSVLLVVGLASVLGMRGRKGGGRGIWGPREEPKPRLGGRPGCPESVNEE